jgi:hypothetical protein
LFTNHFWQIFAWDVWCKLDLGSNPQVQLTRVHHFNLV